MSRSPFMWSGGPPSLTPRMMSLRQCSSDRISRPLPRLLRSCEYDRNTKPLRQPFDKRHTRSNKLSTIYSINRNRPAQIAHCRTVTTRICAAIKQRMSRYEKINIIFTRRPHTQSTGIHKTRPLPKTPAHTFLRYPYSLFRYCATVMQCVCALIRGPCAFYVVARSWIARSHVHGFRELARPEHANGCVRVCVCAVSLCILCLSASPGRVCVCGCAGSEREERVRTDMVHKFDSTEIFQSIVDLLKSGFITVKYCRVG